MTKAEKKSWFQKKKASSPEASQYGKNELKGFQPSNFFVEPKRKGKKSFAWQEFSFPLDFTLEHFGMILQTLIFHPNRNPATISIQTDSEKRERFWKGMDRIQEETK